MLSLRKFNQMFIMNAPKIVMPMHPRTAIVVSVKETMMVSLAGALLPELLDRMKYVHSIGLAAEIAIIRKAVNLLVAAYSPTNLAGNKNEVTNKPRFEVMADNEAIVASGQTLLRGILVGSVRNFDRSGIFTFRYFHPTRAAGTRLVEEARR